MGVLTPGTAGGYGALTGCHVREAREGPWAALGGCLGSASAHVQVQ